MANRGGPRRRPASSGRGGATPQRSPRAPKRAARPEPAASAVDLTPRTFVLAAIPGATPGTWISKWRERMPHVALELRVVPAAEVEGLLAEGEADVALVRLPVGAPDDLHVIRLYDEVPVAVVGAESHLTAADELDLADLAGEVVIVPGDDVLRASVPDAVAPAFAAPARTEDAVATVAAGVGVVLMPMSVARLHARKDVAARPVRDAPVSTVALAWPRARTTPDVETFVGIVRGRTAHSSR